jgi:hypothetical protein
MNFRALNFDFFGEQNLILRKKSNVEMMVEEIQYENVESRNLNVKMLKTNLNVKILKIVSYIGN